MSAADDVDELIDQYHLAQGEFLKGNTEPVKKRFSHREDATLANPYGPPVRAWDEVAKTVDMPHRYAAMASSSVMRSWRSM